MKISGKKILVTGGASGIGFALAQRFSENGNKVIVCGRRDDVLEAAKSKISGLDTFQCDLGNPSERQALAEWLKRNHADLKVLVNNAGIQNWMKISDVDFFERAQQEIRINIEAPIHLTTLLMDGFKLDTVMNVTSGLSFVPLTKVPVYCATKAFLHSFTLSLRHLLKEKGIQVIEIIPPALNTDLGGKGLHDFAPPVGPFIDDIFAQMENGSEELVHGMSAAMAKASADDLKNAFGRMNSQPA